MWFGVCVILPWWTIFTNLVVETVRTYYMDVNMTRSVAFYVQNGGKFWGFFTINTTSIYAVFLDLCLLYAYNKGFYVINHIKQQKWFFMVN